MTESEFLSWKVNELFSILCCFEEVKATFPDLFTIYSLVAVLNEVLEYEHKIVFNSLSLSRWIEKCHLDTHSQVMQN